MKIENLQSQKIIKPEDLRRPERFKNAEKVLNFLNLQKDEKFLFITDNDPYYTDREFIDLLKGKLRELGIEFGEFIADDKKTKKAALNKAAEGYDIIWNSWGMEDSKIDFYEFADRLTDRGGRMAYCPGLNADTLDNDGALAEDKEELDRRLNKMETRLKDVAGFHLTSSYGTDLKIQMLPGQRRWTKENGELNPGDWGNLPGGEIYTTPDEENINGVLVLPVLVDEVTKDQGVDELVHLTIRGGRIAKIDGGKSAEKLREFLEKESKTKKNPLSVLQFSEISFGANSKARSVVSKPEGNYSDISHPTVETEKRLGTMHLAFGSSKHGEAGSEGHTEADIHLDFVIPRNGLTVKAFYDREDFNKGKNYERLIDEGRWRF